MEPQGGQLAKDLRRLLDKKDNAHYGSMRMSANDAWDMIGWAKRMIAGASEVLAR